MGQRRRTTEAVSWEKTRIWGQDSKRVSTASSWLLLVAGRGDLDVPCLGKQCCDAQFS